MLVSPMELKFRNRRVLSTIVVQDIEKILPASVGPLQYCYVVFAVPDSVTSEGKDLQIDATYLFMLSLQSYSLAVLYFIYRLIKRSVLYI